MARPSPLWKRLGMSSPMFSVTAPHGTWDDSRLMSLQLDYGSTLAGLSTSTGTIQVAGDTPPIPPGYQQPINIKLTPAGRDRLTALTGIYGPRIEHRFSGRLAGQTVTDHGTLRTTQITMQDWPAYLSQGARVGRVWRTDPSLAELYRYFFANPGTSLIKPLETWGSVWHWVRFTPEEDHLEWKQIELSDVFGKYAEEVGNLIFQRRDGTPVAVAHDHLSTRADDWRSYNPDPLQRSQVLAPVEWVQTPDIPIGLTWTELNGPGATTTDTYTYWIDTAPGGGHRHETLDMTHIWVLGGEDGLWDSMRARVTRHARGDYHVEKVTVDLLHLLTSPQDVDRFQAGQLLAAEHGDTLALGYDWPGHVDGVAFIEHIGHHITPTSWRVELDLVPANHVTGKSRPGDIAGRTWDTAYPQPATWDTPATTTTWDTVPQEA